MPPRTKCSKEEIAAAAFELIKKEGLSALTARELGKRLGTSSSPIFTLYENMDEVKLAARQLAMEEFRESLRDYQEYTPAFKHIGVMLVMLGIKEPEIFKLLFMQGHAKEDGFRNTLWDLDEIPATCVALIERDYGLKNDEANLMFEQMWTMAFGLGTMCAMQVCTLTEEEIGRRLSVSFAGLMMFLKSGKMSAVHGDVERNSGGTYHGVELRQVPFVPEV